MWTYVVLPRTMQLTMLLVLTSLGSVIGSVKEKTFVRKHRRKSTPQQATLHADGQVDISSPMLSSTSLGSVIGSVKEQTFVRENRSKFTPHQDSMLARKSSRKSRAPSLAPLALGVTTPEGYYKLESDDLHFTTSRSRCRTARMAANLCEGPVLHPDVVQDYETFTHLVVEGLKKNCHDSGGGPLSAALDDFVHDEDAKPNNWFLEFGAASGSTARTISQRLKNMQPGSEAGQIANFTKLHSFDSFKGLPSWWDKGFADNDGFASGAFTQQGQPPYTDSHVVWEIGFFNETLPPFVHSNINKDSRIVLLFVDPDIYPAAHTVFSQLGPHIGHETLIPFHELVNYPSYREGELLALWEWFSGPDGQCVELLGGHKNGTNKVTEDFNCDRKDSMYNCDTSAGSQGPEDQLVRVLAAERRSDDDSM